VVVVVARADEVKKKVYDMMAADVAVAAGAEVEVVIMRWRTR
jgi:hypothetical protein